MYTIPNFLQWYHLKKKKTLLSITTRILSLIGTTCLIGEGNGNPLQYSCLENPMDGGAWLATVHGVAESQTWLSDFTSSILRNSSSSIEAIRTFNFRKCCFSPERRQMWKKHSDVTFQLIMNSYTSVFLFFF